jgi:ATP-dependent Lon protease
MSGPTQTERLHIPLFPLPNVVLFPGMTLRLNIFEPRYREMIQWVLETEGTFGIQLCKAYNPISLQGTPFDVGTTVKLVDVEPLPDGRYHLCVTGDRRFRVEAYDESRAFLQGTVDWLEESDARSVSQSSRLVEETRKLFYEAIRLARKILKEEFCTPEFPEKPDFLSYYIAENLRGSLVLKQELLEMTSTRDRLKRERDILSEIVKTLAAQAQIEEAFGKS